MEKVILVNARDEAIGEEEKMEAHRKGLLHRAFSVFIFDRQGRMLLQQRAEDKYHSGGLWTNACCSHPRPGEETSQAAHRRLFEEIGIRTKLDHLTFFIYKADVGSGLTEHELDHVYSGISDQQPIPNGDEVQSVKWMGMEEIKSEILKKPEDFTPWFRIAMEKLF